MSQKPSVPQYAQTVPWVLTSDTIDSTMETARLTVFYNNVSPDPVFAFLAPDGTDTNLNATCELSAGTWSCSAALDEAFIAQFGLGDYSLRVQNDSGSALNLSGQVTATEATTAPYDIAVGFAQTSTSYPQPLLLTATVSRGLPLTGLNVTATVRGPSGQEFDVTLNDDGIDGDVSADDGTYSVTLPYATNGIYTAEVRADNADGQAQTTIDGMISAPTFDGTEPSFVPASFAENFTRAGSSSASVTGVASDDHASDVTGGACTSITDDNADTNGRIDSAGDIDCFAVVPSSTSNAMYARVTHLAGGMDPVLKVFDNTGTTEIASVTMSNSQNSEVGAVAMISASDLDAAGHIVSVEHSDGSAASGTYRVSFGAGLTSDVAATTPPPPAPGRSGGAMGPWSLLIMSLLAFFGLRSRRRA